MTVQSRFLHRSAIAVLAGALILGSAVSGASPASATPIACATVDRAVQVTPTCTDATYANPVIDSESDEILPLPHHRVHGHFEGTSIEFNIYLHASDDKSQWEGRFFQSTYPIAFTGEENTAETTDRDLVFALNSGGYSVRSGNGSVSIGYRHAAAAAKFARIYAAQYYGSNEPISGYLYGASGGSMQVIGAAENTDGVWQGFVPMVQAVQQPTSYNFLGRAAAALILSDKAADVRAALLPGGSGDPYATLDEAERAMLAEVHALGIPWKGWEYPDYLFGLDPQFYANGIVSDAPLSFDPTYVDDFWNTPGYLGAEQSALGERVRAKLAEMGDTTANRWNIANRFYYRYQIPAASEGWVGLDQFRKPDGSPLYPQRPVVAPISTAASGNAKFDGSITGKVIAVSNLYDTDALPLHTDFYRKRVEASLGAAAANNYRVYFNDHADHQGVPTPGDARSKHLIDWYGSSEQALRDIAAWAEDGVAPPASTKYELVDGQIVVPGDANARRGIQPTVNLTAEDCESVTITAGQAVDLSAVAKAPRGTGSIIKTEWDFDGDGVFEDAPLHAVGPKAHVRATHAFDTPGTYLVALRVTSERNGDVDAVSARVQNLDRVQVVVLPAP